jgi:hypothetical protein
LSESQVRRLCSLGAEIDRSLNARPFEGSADGLAKAAAQFHKLDEEYSGKIEAALTQEQLVIFRGTLIDAVGLSALVDEPICSRHP